MKNKKVNRRDFLHKIVGITALGGIASLILGQKVKKVSGADIQGNITDSQIAYGAATANNISGSDHLKWDNASRNFIGGYSGNKAETTQPIDVTGGTISGGGESGNVNKVTDDYCTVGGGKNNRAGDNNMNQASAICATISGGQNNIASKTNSIVGGGRDNSANGLDSTVGGGYSNTASGQASIIAGGYSNTASHDYATIGGGDTNTASGIYSTVSGGDGNTANNSRATIGGGISSTASGASSTVGGGNNNTASNTADTVGGGELNAASGGNSTVAGGNHNTASGYHSTVAGGGRNTAAGNYSLAAGRRAKIDTNHNGAILFADSTDADFNSANADEFAVRCTNGARFVADSSNPGMKVENTGSGTALHVEGKNYFKSAQRGTIPTGVRDHGVTVSSGITIASDAMIFVTFMDNPSNIGVRYVKKESDFTFRIYLTGKSRNDMPFGYFIVN